MTKLMQKLHMKKVGCKLKADKTSIHWFDLHIIAFY